MKQQSVLVQTIILILISIVIIFAVGLYTLKSGRISKIANNDLSLSDKKLSTTTSQTVSWKTYINNKYGYSIQYPADWYIEGKEIISFLNFDTDTIDDEKGKGFIRIEVLPTEYSSIKTWWNNKIEKCNNSPFNCPQYLENISLDSTKGIKTKEDVSGILSGPAYSYNFIKNNKLYAISIFYGLGSEELLNNEFNQVLSTFNFTDNEVNTGNVKALDIYNKDQLDQAEKDLLQNVTWPRLRPFKTGDKTRNVYLINCEVTESSRLTGIPTDIPNVPNIAETTLKELVKNHYGGFPRSDEITRYSQSSILTFKHKDSGINGVLLKDGVLTVNFYDSVAAYGGGSSRVACMSYATSLTAKQFPTIKEVKMCIDRYDNCETDFQP